MDLSIMVPQQYHIRFSVVGKGTVLADRAGKAFDITDGSEIVVQQGESLTLRLSPAKGYTLSGVTAGGEELTGQVHDGVLITPGFREDRAVSVVFKQQVEEPTASPGTIPPSSSGPDGKGTLSTGDLSAPAAAAVFLAGAAAVIFISRKKSKAA